MRFIQIMLMGWGDAGGLLDHQKARSNLASDGGEEKQPEKGDSKDFYALVTLDLSGLGVHTKVLSSSAPNLEIFDSLFKDGMKPDDWLNAYLELAI